MIVWLQLSTSLSLFVLGTRGKKLLLSSSSTRFGARSCEDGSLVGNAGVEVVRLRSYHTLLSPFATKHF